MFPHWTHFLASNTRRLCLGALLLALPARAATIVWDGDTDTTFLNANNWVGGVAPVSSATADIAQFGSTLTTFQPTLTADRAINGLIFQSTTGGWTLGGGSTLTLGNGGINDTANTSGTTTIDANLVISQAQNWSSGSGGNLLINGLVGITGGARTLTVDSGTVTIQNGFRDGATPRVLTKAGAGTLVLNGPGGTELGGVTLSAGTLQIGHNSALGTGGIILTAGTLQAINGDITLANTSTVTAATISGAHNVTLDGKLTSAANGNRTLTSSLDTGKTLTLVNVDINTDAVNNRTLTIAGTGNTAITGTIANGSGTTANGLTITNTGITTFTGDNTYSGTTTVNAGRLVLAGNNSGAVGAITIGNGATVQAGILANFSAGALQFNAGNTNGNKATLALRSDGSTSIAKNASGVGAAAIDNIAEFNVDRATAGGPTGGTITWGNGGTMTMNTDRGQLLVTGGNGYGLTLNQSLSWAGNNQTNKPNIVNNAPGLLTIQGSVTGANVNSRSLEFTGTGDILVNGTVTGTSFYVNKTGTGTLTLANAVTPTSGSPAYHYLVQSGTLKLAVTAALENGNTANWTATRIAVASGATLAFNVGGTNEFTTGHVTTLLTNLAASTIAVTTTGATANGMNAGSSFGFDTTNASGGSFTIADTIANTTGAAGGARGLTKLGTGTLALTGSNTYSGTTTVSGGSLQVGVSGNGKTGTGDVTVQAGSTLLGTGVIQGSSFTAASGSTVQAGDGTAQGNYGTLTFTPVSGSGSFDFQSGSTVILGINPGGAGDLLNFDGLSAGTLTFNGNLTITATGYTPVSEETFNLLDWANIGTLTFDDRFKASSYGGFLLGNGDDNLGFDLPDISASGFGWDINQFITNGTISTVNLIPEPSRTMLTLLGIIGITGRRRRK